MSGRRLDHGSLHLEHALAVIGEMDEVIEHLSPLIFEHTKRQCVPGDLALLDQRGIAQQQTPVTVGAAHALGAGVATEELGAAIGACLILSETAVLMAGVGLALLALSPPTTLNERELAT
jgi:hypothetical protein